MRDPVAVGRGGALLAGGLAALWLCGSPDALPAQEGGDRITRPAAGVPTLVTPVQRAVPLSDGGWLSGASSRRDLLERMDAELSFALEGDERAAAWTSPRAVRRLAVRNPVLDVDPRHLAVDALPEAGEKLPDALHGQLRGLAALADARYVLLPVRIAYARPDDARGPCPWSPARPDGESTREGEGGAAGGAAAGGDSGAGAEPAGGGAGQAVLCLAVLDVRSTRILWRGHVAGPPSEPGRPGVLAELAERVKEVFVR